jgi:hypothetical protein
MSTQPLREVSKKTTVVCNIVWAYARLVQITAFGGVARTRQFQQHYALDKWSAKGGMTSLKA